jgi:hypothetical protein
LWKIFTTATISREARLVGDNDNPYEVPGLGSEDFSAFSPAGPYALGQAETRFLRRWFGRRRWARVVVLVFTTLLAAALMGGCFLHLAGVLE